MPFNVIPLANTCHALGYNVCLMLDALIFFRWPLRATEMRLSARVLNLMGLWMHNTCVDSNRSGFRVRFYS